MNSDNNEIILKIGSEGGRLTVYGVRDGDGWLYSLRLIDQSYDILGEGNSVIDANKGVTRYWGEVLIMLDRYPWLAFEPIEFHPEFKEKIWEAYMDRRESPIYKKSKGFEVSSHAWYSDFGKDLPKREHKVKK